MERPEHLCLRSFSYNLLRGNYFDDVLFEGCSISMIFNTLAYWLCFRKPFNSKETSLSLRQYHN